MEGANQPLHDCSQQDMTMALRERYFLTSVASQLCDNFLFVVGKLTMEEQKDLLSLCNLCKSSKKKIFVVHNFKDVKTEEDFNYHIEEMIALLGARESDTTANWVPRKVGTVFTDQRTKGPTDEVYGKGRISRADGNFVHVEYQKNQETASFTVHDWQDLVRQDKIQREVDQRSATFAVEHYQNITTIRGKTEDGVEQVHFFLACDPSVSAPKALPSEPISHLVDGKEHRGKIVKKDDSSVLVEWEDAHNELQVSFQIEEWQQLVRDNKILHSEGSVAGANWNKCTIEHLRNYIIAAGERRTGVDKDPGRFDFLDEIFDAMAKLMPKVFRAEGDATEKLPKASPQLMKLCDVGHFRLWANLEGKQPGSNLRFLPEGLYSPNEDLTYQGTDARDFVRTNQYKRTKVLEDGFVVEQRRFVLEIPGYEPVDEETLPDNQDIQIYEDHGSNVLEVSLTRKPPIPADGEWADVEGVDQHIHQVETKPVHFEFEGNCDQEKTEIHQGDGVLTITISGKRKRSQRNR
jgi:hypothetical protein